MEWERAGSERIQDHSSLTTMDEKLASLFQPDALATAQYFGNLRRKTYLQPEKRLMLAILEDAINCYQDNLAAERGKGKKLFSEAKDWFAEAGGDWLFSFANICEVLGIDPDYVRQGLLRWKEENLTKRRLAEAWEQRKATRVRRNIAAFK